MSNNNAKETIVNQETRRRSAVKIRGGGGGKRFKAIKASRVLNGRALPRPIAHRPAPTLSI